MEIMWFRLMSIIRENILGDDRVVLVQRLMLVFSLNFEKIIADEIKTWATKTNTTYLFPWLITRLCEEAHVSFDFKAGQWGKGSKDI